MMHGNTKLKQSSLFIILQVHSTCFGCPYTSWVHKTVTTASITGHFFFVQLPPCKLAWTCWRAVAAQKIWPVPEAVVTVLCTPDDGCGWHPKHVEWTFRIINRLLFAASRWSVINIHQRCTNHKHKKHWPSMSKVKQDFYKYFVR